MEILLQILKFVTCLIRGCSNWMFSEKKAFLKIAVRQVKCSVKTLKRYLWRSSFLLTLHLRSQNKLLHMYFFRIFTPNFRTPIFRNTSQWLLLNSTFHQLLAVK